MSTFVAHDPDVRGLPSGAPRVDVGFNLRIGSIALHRVERTRCRIRAFLTVAGGMDRYQAIEANGFACRHLPRQMCLEAILGAVRARRRRIRLHCRRERDAIDALGPPSDNAECSWSVLRGDGQRLNEHMAIGQRRELEKNHPSDAAARVLLPPLAPQQAAFQIEHAAMFEQSSRIERQLSVVDDYFEVRPIGQAKDRRPAARLGIGREHAGDERRGPRQRAALGKRRARAKVSVDDGEDGFDRGLAWTRRALFHQTPGWI